jgi:GAF domain-containing protein
VSEHEQGGMEMVREFARLLFESVEPAVVAQRAAVLGRALLRAPVSGLYWRPGRDSALVGEAVSGDVGPGGDLDERLPSGRTLVELAAKSARPFVTSDARSDARVGPVASAAPTSSGDRYAAAIAVPLLEDGQAQGGLVVAAEPGRVFDEHDVELAVAFAGHAARAMSIAERLFQAERRGWPTIEDSGPAPITVYVPAIWGRRSSIGFA